MVFIARDSHGIFLSVFLNAAGIDFSSVESGGAFVCGLRVHLGLSTVASITVLLSPLFGGTSSFAHEGRVCSLSFWYLVKCVLLNTSVFSGLQFLVRGCGC